MCTGIVAADRSKKAPEAAECFGRSIRNRIWGGSIATARSGSYTRLRTRHSVLIPAEKPETVDETGQGVCVDDAWPGEE